MHMDTPGIDYFSKLQVRHVVYLDSTTSLEMSLTSGWGESYDHIHVPYN